jgi:hypothetical protein
MDKHRARRFAGLATAGLLALGLAAPAHAKGGDPAPVASTSNFVVTVNGTTYDPAPGRDVRLKDLAVTGKVAVRGVNVAFTIDPATLGVYDYTLTGAPSPERMVTRPTVIFASKVPDLTAAQLRAPRLRELQVRDGDVVAIFATAAGKLKVQAKDAPQGGIFQMEPEFAGPVVITHTLGPGLFYFVNAYTQKINFGDGIEAVTAAQNATGYHRMLLGKDSPQVATKLEQTATTTRWSVTSGGRMGGVLGEDAIELSQGATQCTHQCQAQNRIQGSVPVPPDPLTPTPLP